jgi:ATP-dependent Clp protease protease subunit
MGEKTVEKPKKKDAQAVSHKAKRREIELKKAELELRSTEIDLELDRMTLTARRRDERRKKNEDQNLGIFALESSVGSNVVTLSNELRRWARANGNEGKPITLNIFSPGGSIFHGVVLYDTLRTLSKQGHTVTTVARGYAASMGSLIFLAGDVRLVGGETYLMFHALSTMTGGSLHDLIDEVEFCKQLDARLNKIVVSRTKITSKMLKEKTRKVDWWVDPETALELGVAHEIV